LSGEIISSLLDAVCLVTDSEGQPNFEEKKTIVGLIRVNSGKEGRFIKKLQVVQQILIRN